MDPHLYSGDYLIRGEDPEEFAALCEEYRRKFGPVCATTECLVDNLIYTEWRMRRYRKLETSLIAHYSREAASPFPAELENKTFRMVRDHIASLNRTYQASLSVLRKEKSTPQPSRAKGQTAKLGSKPYLVTPPPPKTRPN